MLFKRQDVGIDLGTATVLIYVKGRGIVLREPSVVAWDNNTKEIRGVGYDAQKMLGRAPGNVSVMRPLRDGVISDYLVTLDMLQLFLKKALPKRTFFHPRVMVCVPSGVTEVEQRAVREAVYKLGAKQVYVIEEPLAAAIGANIDIFRPCGNMVVDIGGGTTDIAVLSLGSSVVSESIKCAGDKMDEAIVKYMKKKNNLLIGERTAEMLKINIGTAYPRSETLYTDVMGRNLLTGLPKSITVSSEDIREALTECLDTIINSIYRVLDTTPPELAADIYDNGILLTGGGSLLFGLDKLLTNTFKLNCYVAEDAISCVALGTGKCLDNLDFSDPNSSVYDYKKTTIS